MAGGVIDQGKLSVWQPIIGKYKPTLIGECEKTIEWSKEMAKDWLKIGMLKNVADAEQKATDIWKIFRIMLCRNRMHGTYPLKSVRTWG